jgi:L-threonylcarbamoyladenylate synthase
VTAGRLRTVTGAGGLDAVVRALDDGLVVAIPTDTVYGLAARIDRPGAIDAVFAAKGRPASLALPVLVAGVDQVDALAAEWPPEAARLAARHWPGALTLVVLARPGIGRLVGGGGDTVGIRWPDHPVAEALCRASGPLAVTSANRHGDEPCQRAGDVERTFPPPSPVALVYDGGVASATVSTVLDCTVRPPVCLRAGGIDVADGSGA